MVKLCLLRAPKLKLLHNDDVFFAGFFVSSWMIVWVDGVNGFGWCLAGGGEC